MTLAGTLALLLVLSPAGIFVGHVLAYRTLRAADRHPTAHTSAIAGIALCFVALLVVAGLSVASLVGRSITTAAFALVYVAVTYAALSILYLDVVNIAETSLHMHLLLEIAWDDRLQLDALVDKYNPAHMVGERLERLTALGQVRRDGDRSVLGDRSALRLAKTMDVWRRVIGLPTSPDEALSGR